MGNLSLIHLFPYLQVVVKEDYYAGALYNDIALLFLSEDVTFAPNIDTVCLPSPNINFDGQRCFASGWGKDSFGKTITLIFLTLRTRTILVN